MNHKIYMQRCLQLAEKGLSTVAPNPMVGAVIVHEGKIIGEGYHQKYGEAHAEVNAIASVKDKNLLKTSTLYVNLEPCAHFGKTPPCANAIVENKIPQVVIGTKDIFGKVNGKGIEILEKSGVKTIVGTLEDECLQLNKRFFTFHDKKRPYIVLKWANTKDGFIDKIRSENAKPEWITNDLAKLWVHKWRTEEQAIMVGSGTAFKDNPQLNVRMWTGNNPLRVILDNSLQLPTHLHVFDNTQPTIIFNSIKSEKKDNTEFIKIDFSDKKSVLKQILDVLYEKNIQSLFVEGGQKLLQSFIDHQLWDEARVFIGNKIFGMGIKQPIFTHKNYDLTTIGDCQLKVFLHRNQLQEI